MEEEEDKKKWGYSKFARWIVTKILSRYLGKYLDITSKKIRATLGKNSEFSLYDINLREDALDELRLPIFVLPRSTVKELNCQIQVRYTSSTVKITLRGIKILARRTSYEWSSKKWRKFKKKKLLEWEKNQKDIFRQVNTKSFITKRLILMVNNINLTIENLVICIAESDILGYPCALRIGLQKIKLQTTNDKYEPNLCSDLHTIFKHISIEGLSIALSCDPVPENIKDYSSDEEAKNEEYIFSNVDFSERHYILRPSHIILKYKMQNMEKSQEPIHQIHVEANELILSINELQLHFIQGFMNLVSHANKTRRYEELKPDGRILGNEKAWWSFLINSIKKDLKFTTPEDVERMAQVHEKYIDCYKRNQKIIHAPWLREIDEESKQFLKIVEKEYSAKEIIQLRVIALYQLKIEAMSFVKTRGSVMGKTHLGDLWDYYLNDFESLLADPQQTVSEEKMIELTRAEKRELTQLLKMDTLMIVDSYLSGKSSELKDRMFNFKFAIGQIRVFLQKTQVDPWSTEGLYERETQVLVHSSSQRFEHPIDTVKNISMVNTDGGPIDPKLVREHTLLVIETGKVSGCLEMSRDQHIKTMEKISIKDCTIFDPMIFGFPEKLRSFQKKYGYDHDKTLIESILRHGLQEYPAYSLRFFLRDVGFLPELEYLIHYQIIFMPSYNFYCLCTQEIDSEEKLIQHFIYPGGLYCLHLPAHGIEKFEKSMDKKKELEIIYKEILMFLNNSVLKQFLCCNFRWITFKSSRNIELYNRKSREISIMMELEGNYSPITVKFHEKNKKHQEYEDLKEEEVSSFVNVDFNLEDNHDFEVKLTTPTVIKLISWFCSIPPTGQFNDINTQLTMLDALNNQNISIKEVYNIINNAGKTSYDILTEIHNKLKENKIILYTVHLPKLKLHLMESNFKQNDTVPLTYIIIKNFALTNKVSKEGQLGQYYVTHRLQISDLVVVHHEKILLLQMTEIQLDYKLNFLGCHPLYPESVVDFYSSKFILSVREELTTFLGLLTSIDIPKRNVFDLERSTLEKKVFNADRRKLQDMLMKLHEQHFDSSDEQCVHCLLRYRKIVDKTNIMIGSRNSKSIKIVFYSSTPNLLIALETGFILAMSESKLFNKTLRIFMSDWESSLYKHGSIKINPKTPQNGEDFPLFNDYDLDLTPNIFSNFQTRGSDPYPVYLVAHSRESINSKIFDENEWDRLDTIKMKEIYPDYPGNVETNKNELLIGIDSISIKIETDFYRSPIIKSLLSSYLVKILLDAYQENNAIISNSLPKSNYKLAFRIKSLRFQSKFQLHKFSARVRNFEYLKYKTLANREEIRQSDHLGLSVTKVNTLKQKRKMKIESFSASLGHILTFHTEDIRFKFKDIYVQNKEFQRNVFKDCYIRSIHSEMNGTVKVIWFARIDQDFSYVCFCPGSINEEAQIGSNGQILALQMNQFTTIERTSDAVERISNPFERSSFKTEKTYLEISPTAFTLQADFFSRCAQEFRVILGGSFGNIMSGFNKGKNAHSFIKNNVVEYVTKSKSKMFFEGIDMHLNHSEDFTNYLRVYGLQISNNERGFTKIYSDELHWEPQNYQFTSLLLKKNGNRGITLEGRYSEDTLKIYSHNCRLVYLTRAIEELSSYIRIVSNNFSTGDPEEESSFIFDLELLESEIFFPEHSYSEDMAILHFGKAKFQKFNQPVIMDLDDQEVNCGLMKIEFEQAEVIARLSDHFTQFASSNFIELNLYTPTNEEYLNQKIAVRNIGDIEFNDLSLSTSLGKMLLLNKVFKSNIDEPIKGFEKKVSSKTTKLNIKIAKAQLDVKRWLTKPLKSPDERKEISE